MAVISDFIKDVLSQFDGSVAQSKRLNEPTEEQVSEGATRILCRFMRSGFSVADAPEVSEAISKAASILRLSEIRGTSRPTKGVLLVGPVGCGKTTLMRECFKMCKVIFKATSDVIYEFQRYHDSFEVDRRTLSHADILLDDLGAERDGKRFGQTFDLGEWIEWRYKVYKDFGALTYITTNLSSKQAIANAYNERIASRVCEMCEPVVYNGRDRRGPKVLP